MKRRTKRKIKKVVLYVLCVVPGLGPLVGDELGKMGKS